MSPTLRATLVGSMNLKGMYYYHQPNSLSESKPQITRYNHHIITSLCPNNAHKSYDRILKEHIPDMADILGP